MLRALISMVKIAFSRCQLLNFVVCHVTNNAIICISQRHADEIITLRATRESRLCHFFATSDSDMWK